MLIIDIQAYEREKERLAKIPKYYYTYEIKNHVSDNMKRYYKFLFKHHNYSVDKLVNTFPNDTSTKLSNTSSNIKIIIPEINKT